MPSRTDNEQYTDEHSKSCEWCMVIAGFFISSICDGIIYTFGIMFPMILEEFRESKEKTAWIGSLARGHVQLIGIIVGPLTRHFGCCLVTMIGSAIAFLALVISYFAVSVLYLDFFYGVLGGCGMGLCIHPAVIATTVHFKKRRGCAVGIVTAGSGAGTFILGPFSYWIIGYVGWRGNCLISGCLILLCIPLAIFLTPDNPCHCWKYCGLNIKKSYVPEVVPSRSISRSISYTYSSDFPGTPVSQNSISSVPSITSRKVYHLTPAKSFRAFFCKTWRVKIWAQTNHATENKCKNFLKFMTSFINFCVLRYPRFIFVVLSGIVISLGLFVPPIFLLDFANSVDVNPTHASYLFSILGVQNMLTRIFAGWLTDRDWANLLAVYIGGVFIGGGTTIMIAFYHNYVALVVFAAAFGGSLGCILALRSTMLMEVMGMDLFYDSFSVYLLFTGMAALSGPPFAGLLFDLTKSYPWTFVISGSIMLSGIIFWACVWMIICLEQRANKNQVVANSFDPDNPEQGTSK